MKSSITFTYEHGEFTCASSPGKFCNFFDLRLSGPSQCALFNCSLGEEDGWVQRCDECLENSNPKEK
jgi:hypothetical protein